MPDDAGVGDGDGEREACSLPLSVGEIGGVFSVG